MALIQCPECNGKVSDRAATCPHCGFPLINVQTSDTRPRSPGRKHSKASGKMRLPNGFGSISYQGPNRRKPYYARKTIGKNEFGQPILKPIQPEASFATYNEAYQALMKYNEKPYDKKFETTFRQAYESWSSDYFTKKELSDSRRNAWETAFRYCEELHDKRISDLKTFELESFLKNIQRSALIKIDIRALMIQLDAWALKYEIIEKNYADLTDVIPRPASTIERIVFPNKEVEKLWNARDLICADMILVGLYSGLRPSEICELESEKVNLDEHYMIGGIKTDAGIDRLIPIHDKIYDIIKSHKGSGRLFKLNGEDINYRVYRYRFRLIMEALNLTHTPHDTRHTFITKAKKSGLNEYCLKLIIGHAINDITEKIYTHRTPSELLMEINKISY